MSHVVFGTGPVGMAVVERLHSRGEHVTAVNRSGHAPVPDGVVMMGGDASDPEFAIKAARAADVVYQCAAPPYTQWSELFPKLQESIVEATATASAKLVSFENLYMYGPSHGAPITESMGFGATSRKGRLRAQMAKDLAAAARAGRIRLTTGRASDYFGPRAMLSHAGERMFRPVMAGKKAQMMGDPDQPHTYSFVPDIAAGLVELGMSEAADGKVWHLPNPRTVTPRQFVDRIGLAYRVSADVSAMSRRMVSVVGMFNKDVKEIKEVLYQFEEPWVVDSTAFADQFGISATPLDEAIATTAEWHRTHQK